MDHEETWAFGGASADHEAVLRRDTRPTRHPAVKAAGQTEKKRYIAVKILDPNLGKPEVVIEIPIESTISWSIREREREREREYIIYHNLYIIFRYSI